MGYNLCGCACKQTHVCVLVCVCVCVCVYVCVRGHYTSTVVSANKGSFFKIYFNLILVSVYLCANPGLSAPSPGLHIKGALQMERPIKGDVEGSGGGAGDVLRGRQGQTACALTTN